MPAAETLRAKPTSLSNARFADPTASAALKSIGEMRAQPARVSGGSTQARTAETPVFLPSQERTNFSLVANMISDLNGEMHRLRYDGRTQNIDRREYIPRHRTLKREFQLLQKLSHNNDNFLETSERSRSGKTIEGIFLTHDLLRVLRKAYCIDEVGKIQGKFIPAHVVDLLGKRNRLSSEEIRGRFSLAAAFLTDLVTSARLMSSRDPRALVRTGAVTPRNLFKASRLSYLLITDYSHEDGTINNAFNPIQVVEALADRNGSTFEDTLHDLRNTQRLVQVLAEEPKRPV